MRLRHLPDLGDVGSDPLRQIAPEQMYVGMFRRHFPGLARAAAKIEFRIWLLQRPRPDMRAGQFVEFAVEVQRAGMGPQRCQDRDLLLHQRVAFFLGVAHALGRDFTFVLARDQIDADAPARHLVEGRDHLGQQHRVDVAGARRDQRLYRRRPRRHERARDPRLPAGRADRDQEILKPRLLGGLHHAVAQFGRPRHLRRRHAIGRGVAMRGQIPAEFERTHGRISRESGGARCEAQFTACMARNNHPGSGLSAHFDLSSRSR